MAITTTLDYTAVISTILLGPRAPSFYEQLENACLKVVPPAMVPRNMTLWGIDAKGVCTWDHGASCGGEVRRYAFFKYALAKGPELKKEAKEEEEAKKEVKDDVAVQGGLTEGGPASDKT